MRDDLLHAQASVDWAVARMPDLQERLDSWASANVSVEIEDAPPPAGQNPVVATLKEPIPLAFSVEVGAYLNTIRSGLGPKRPYSGLAVSSALSARIRSAIALAA